MPKSASPQADLDERRCITCDAAFQPYRASQVACSRRCRESTPHVRARVRAYDSRPERRERQRQARQVIREADPGRYADLYRASNLRRYGITLQDYDRMHAEQQGRCAACGSPPKDGGRGPAGRLHVDHDHDTGAVRGLLCNNCNAALGQVGDSADRLRMLLTYLGRHQ